MSTHPQYEDLMMEALFGDISSDDRRQLDAHLDTCEACREEFESLQSTLDVVDQREREELPEAYWASYRRQVKRKIDRRGRRSLGERLRQWWQSLPVLLPQTGGQWAVQGALAILFVAVGLWIGQPSADDRTTGAAETVSQSEDTPLSDLVLARSSVPLEQGQVHPTIDRINDIAFDPTEGTVEVRYRTANEVSVTGRPDDPAVQRLLQTALLDSDHPSSQLRALQTLERADLSPTDELTEALTVLILNENNTALQVRGVRALRSLHHEAPLTSNTRNLLVGLVLDDRPEALRVEALQTLMQTPGSSDNPEYLYAVQNDPNAYLRYQAQASLQHVQQSQTVQQ